MAPLKMKPVSVAVRCRMILPHDRDQRVCINTRSDREIQCLDPEHLHHELREKNGRVDYLKENHCRERSYTFDAVFGPSATTSQLYEHLAAPLVPQVLGGKHGTCFAYGMTGSGKTHTMLGRQGEEGIVERVLGQLLSKAKKLAQTKVTMTFVEVYNEKLRDLLVPRCPVLDLRDDALRGPCIAGVREVPATTVEEVMRLVREGNERRTEERTAANPVSSRSHAVLQLTVERPVQGKSKKLTAKMSLIDLAGSERAANTGNRGDRLREGAMINRSLLALANCITALTRKGAYVNYRDSKLTRLLKDSLSGNCYTVMIAHVSPSISAFEETLNTLKYAHRACEIRGMCGGVKENFCDVAQRYADRMQPILDATSGLKHQVAQLTVMRPAPAPADVTLVSKVVQLAEDLEAAKTKVLTQMRERLRHEQTVLELDDQNQSNDIELSKLELDVMMDAEAVKENIEPEQDEKYKEKHLVLLKDHIALRAASKKNSRQRHEAEQLSSVAEEIAEQAEEAEANLVSLLADAKKVIEGESTENEVEKRLLQAQHQVALLEIEKLEAEQGRVMLEAAARQHALALKKQKLQLDLHARALAAAEGLLAKRDLLDEWRAALGPLEKLLPRSPHAGPSLDELLAEVSAPATPVGSRPGTSRGLVIAKQEEKPPSYAEADAKLERIEEDFNEMRATLSRSVKLAEVEDEEDEDEAEEGQDSPEAAKGRSKGAASELSSSMNSTGGYPDGT